MLRVLLPMLISITSDMMEIFCKHVKYCLYVLYLSLSLFFLNVFSRFYPSLFAVSWSLNHRCLMCPRMTVFFFSVFLLLHQSTMVQSMLLVDTMVKNIWSKFWSHCILYFLLSVNYEVQATESEGCNGALVALERWHDLDNFRWGSLFLFFEVTIIAYEHSYFYQVTIIFLLYKGY